jgi:hypothetical protein
VARPPSDSEQYDFAYALFVEVGSKPTYIEQCLLERYGDARAVKIRTLGNWVKDFRKRDISLDQPFEWHQIDDYQAKGFGIPWEASEFILELWYRVKEQFSAYEENAGSGPLREPTIREVRWWWRIHLADPKLPHADPELQHADPELQHFIEIYVRGRDFATDERYQQFVDPSWDNLRGRWRELAYKPLKSAERRQQYEQATVIRFTTPDDSGLETWRRGNEMQPTDVDKSGESE